MKTPDWDASQDFLREHQEKLLTQEAVQALQLLVLGNNSNQTLQHHLEILRQAVAKGIEAAYQNLKNATISGDPENLQALADLLIQWVKTPDWDASEQYLIEHQEKLLTEDAVKALQMLIMSNDGNPTLRQHLQILQRAINEGIEAAYAPLKNSPLEQLQELRKAFDQVQKPEEVQAVIAMSLLLGERFLRQEDIPHDDLKQFIADCESFVLPRAEESGEEQLVIGCKHLLGWAYNTLNVQYDNQKDYPQALAAVSKAIEYKPNEAIYYRNRARTHIDMKAYASALPDLEKAQELDGDNNRLARLWHDCLVGIGEPARLFGKIAYLLEKHPDQANIHYYIALAHAYTGNDVASIGAMRESSRLASDNQRQSGISTLDELLVTLPDFAPIIVKLVDVLKEMPND